MNTSSSENGHDLKLKPPIFRLFIYEILEVSVISL